MTVTDENNRMRVLMKSLLLSALVAGLLCACKSPAPPAVEPIPEQSESTGVEPESEPEPETAVEPEPRNGAEADDEFVVTVEVYTKTFDEIEEFIQNLNTIIRNVDYDTWLTFLSKEYIERTSDPEYLKQQSEKPLLKKSSIRLNSLKDYFEYVVVPSRTQATLDEIEFVGEDQVKAYAKIGNTKALLYLLVRESEKWKIGVW